MQQMIKETIHYLKQPENICIAAFLGYVLFLQHAILIYVLFLCYK